MPSSNGEVLAELLDQQIVPHAPKYVALRAAILNMIEGEHWQSGDQLPPEQEMSRLTGLSLGTVQRALATLAEDGILKREQGRGTFVAPPEMRLLDPWHLRFVAEEGGEALPVYAKALSRGLIEDRGPWSEFLDESESESEFVCLRRLIDINHEFACYNVFYLGANRFRRVAKMRLSALHGRNFKHVLAEEFGVETRHVSHRIRAGRFDRAAVEALGVKRTSIGLIVDMFGYAYRRRPLYYQRAFIPANQRWLAPGV